MPRQIPRYGTLLTRAYSIGDRSRVSSGNGVSEEEGASEEEEDEEEEEGTGLLTQEVRVKASKEDNPIAAFFLLVAIFVG